MTEEDWFSIKHFSPLENWGDPFCMSRRLLYLLDAWRDFIECPVVVHCGFEEKGHSEKSQHYLGNAVDLHVVGMSLLYAYLSVERFGFTGIGVYPYWSSPGLHLDVRPLGELVSGARWWRDGNGAYGLLGKEAMEVLLGEC